MLYLLSVLFAERNYLRMCEFTFSSVLSVGRVVVYLSGQDVVVVVVVVVAVVVLLALLSQVCTYDMLAPKPDR